MGRTKAAQNCKIRPWLSAKPDCREGRFLLVGNSLLLSPKFHDLSPGAKILYFCACQESGGRNEFTFPARTMKKYGIKERSGRRYLQELIEHDFIRCACSGKNLRTDSEYAFTLQWKEV